MTLLTGNLDVLCDAELMEAWRPDWVEPHAILPADLDVQKMRTDVALAEVKALGAEWTRQMLAEARASARSVARRELCCKGNEAMIEDFLVTRCEAICKRMRVELIGAVVDATIDTGHHQRITGLTTAGARFTEPSFPNHTDRRSQQ